MKVQRSKGPRRARKPSTMAGGHWHDTTQVEKRKLMQTGLRCPGCNSPDLVPLDPGTVQLLCNTCWRILSMNDQLRLRGIGRIVDGIRCYEREGDRICQELVRTRGKR